MERSSRVVVGVIGLVVMTVAVLGGWWLRGASGADGAAAATLADIEAGAPTIVSPAELEEFAGSHYPLYWAGELPDTQIELTLTSVGGIFVRYLPEGVEAGSDDQYLTVGTYQAVDGYSSLVAAGSQGAEVTHAQSGATIATFDSNPLSTYFSFPEAAFQVEVFSPVPEESSTMTDDGTITLVGGER